MYDDKVGISILVGKTLVAVEDCVEESFSIMFVTDSGERFKLYHEQDCCESVFVEDVCGDISDLTGSPIVVAEEVSSDYSDTELENRDYSYTWTFYKIDTQKGGVTIRWFGSSNGYYSERASFIQVS